MKKEHTYSLFEGFGVEMEYMIVDKTTLKVAPIADKLMHAKSGDFTVDVENGEIQWSNELVTHVIEIKTNGPAKNLENHPEIFHKNVKEINAILEKENCCLMPTSAHPLMDPNTETVIWPHEYNEVYSLYNKIFDCRGHGWSNLQSTHINLPFKNDEEFGKLHAAIRIILPLLPAIAASSPMLDGKLTGFQDSRMETYLHNQEKIPSIMGKLVPERVFSEEAYYDKIFNPIMRDIKPYDSEGILSHHFLNSRGAIARFDRGAIEIRIIDIQECPSADLSIVYAVVGALKLLIAEPWKSIEDLKKFDENYLFDIFNRTIKDGQKAIIDKEFAQIFGLKNTSIEAGTLWKYIYDFIKGPMPVWAQKNFSTILKFGNLSSRITQALGSENPSKEEIENVYRKLTVCLDQNKQFFV